MAAPGRPVRIIKLHIDKNGKARLKYGEIKLRCEWKLINLNTIDIQSVDRVQVQLKGTIKNLGISGDWYEKDEEGSWSAWKDG